MLTKLKSIKANWCFKPANFEKIKEYSLHHFSDASKDGYGQFIAVHCSLVIAKARVFPLKYVYITLLGLAALTLSVKIPELLKEDLDIMVSKEVCGNDS